MQSAPAAQPPNARRVVDRAPELVGILNVTADSFYDGGRYLDPPRAVRHGLDLFAAGASWVDVGGMSTRPGSEEIPEEEEISRVEPVIAGLVGSLRSNHETRAASFESRAASSLPADGHGEMRHCVSVDTYRAKVAESALAAGASCINDVSGFGLDPAMCEFAASADCPVVINHMQGTPQTMQVSPSYDNLWDELLRFFESRLARFLKAGGRESNAMIDPGIGFGKTLGHNLEILRGLARLHQLGRPVFLGCSRKSFISDLNPQSLPAGRRGAIRNPQSPKDRLPGSLAAAAWAALSRVQFLRVHDVAETTQFLKVFLAIASD